MTTTVADVNWMLGAAVQSGAALVAIVGGLLGSRYVPLHAEQQTAQRRLDEVTARPGALPGRPVGRPRTTSPPLASVGGGARASGSRQDDDRL